jgi:hypothetical protein
MKRPVQVLDLTDPSKAKYLVTPNKRSTGVSKPSPYEVRSYQY